MKKWNSAFILLTFIILISSPAHGQTVYLLNDFTSSLSAPFEKKNLTFSLPLISAGVVCFFYDEKIQNEIKNLQSYSDKLNPFMKAGKTFGNTSTGIILSLTLITTGHLLGEYKVRSGGILLLESLLFSGVIVNSVKFITGRPRPYLNEGSTFFKNPFSFKTGYKSFFSGHTIVAFTTASCLSYYYKVPALTVVLFTFATLTCVERVYKNKHWTSDIIFGALFGFFIGKKVVEMHLNDDERYLKIRLFQKKF